MNTLHTNKTNLLGIFASSLLVAASAVYIYSPTFGSHADSSATADITLNVGETMSLTLDKNNLALEANTNSFVSGDITATVSTNSQYGYTLTLEDVDSSSNMAHTNANVDAALTSNFGGAKTSAEMSDNTWGFSLNATDFYRIPENGSPVSLKRTDSAMETTSESTAVTFGAKVGVIASGTYSDSVLFTMYTNGQTPETSPTEPGYISPCATAAYVSNGILTDPRDGKTYTVKALKDGQCWMTQNLALGGDTPITITSENSDVTADFTLPTHATSGFDSTDTNLLYASSDSIKGNLYPFYTATAGTGGSTLESGEAPSSICPKGWRLPTGGYAQDKEFNKIFSYYPSSELMQGEPNFTLFANISGRWLNEGGGYYWSSTVLADNVAYALYVGSSSVNSEISYGKMYGFSVRCVAR